MKQRHDPDLPEPRAFASYAEFERHLDSRGLFRMDLSLGRMEAFLKAVVREHGPLPFPVLQVVGTNGKGSTSSFLASMAQTHGLVSGLYLSPHFVSPRERILVSGCMLGEDAWVRLGNRALDLGRGLGLTYFELLTAMSVLAFVEAGVDVAVYEAGLGGHFDATTALPALLTAFASIGLDHQAVLGPTIADIARDKAMALRPGGIGVTGPQPPEAMEALRRRAREAGARLVEVDPAAPDDFSSAVLGSAHISMSGRFQRVNAALALAAFQLFAESRALVPDREACGLALAGTIVPGRMQRVPGEGGEPDLLLDGAHNLPAMTALTESLSAEGTRPKAMIFTALGDKNLDDMLPLILGLTDGPILVPPLPGNERAVPPEAMAARLGPRARAVAGVKAALDELRGHDGPVLVCGSLYLLAEFFTLRPGSLAGRLAGTRPCKGTGLASRG